MPNGTGNRSDPHVKPATMIRKTPNEHPLLFLISIVVFIEPLVIISRHCPQKHEALPDGLYVVKWHRAG